MAEHPDILTPECERYLAQLTAMSLARLAREPGALQAEKSSNQQAQCDLAVRHYASFIEASSVLSSVYADFTDVAERVGAMLGRLPALAARQRDFASVSCTVLEQRSVNRSVLEFQQQLHDLLDAPQLMEALVRADSYDEALELARFTASLARRMPGVPVVASVASDVQLSTLKMFSQIEAALQGEVPTALCIRLVGYLRRLELFSPVELRLVFLSARDVHIREMLDAVGPGETPQKYILDYIGALRVQTLAVLTQYRTVFPDDALSSASASALSPSSASADDDELLPLHGIFTSWVLRTVDGFISFLSSHLRDVHEGAAIAAIAARAVQFGQSLARVGVDCRGLLPRVFEQAALGLYTRSLREAARAFDVNLRRFVWSDEPLAANAELATSAAASGRAAPTALLRFPLLALACDALCDALNELRDFAPLAIAEAAASATESSLTAMASSCDALLGEGRLSVENVRRVRSMRDAAADVLVPFALRAVESLFGSSAALAHARAAALARVWAPHRSV